MALGSNNDEEFDWEAAVAEIDDACNKAVLHTTLHEDASPSFLNNDDDNGVKNPIYKTLELNKNKVGKKLDKAVRQSTLDKFVEVSEKHSEGHQTHHANITTTCGDDNVLYSMGGSKTNIDPIAAQTWTYPGNVPLRDYQFLIVKTALFSNTLVSLPTGLGKTLIAAVVMYNYFRWFPAGKIVFTAPSRPLVLQQIEACHNIVGIPQEWTIDMTGQMNPAQRLGFWQSKRVFFVTPQVLEKDIQSGSCLVKELVCFVVDEAHRAMGNYAYCVVVREIMAVPVQLRILALTATPGSKQATIQMVIDNLQISTLEYRNENDPDVRKYVHNKNIDLITVAMGKESVNVSNLLLEVITPVVQKLCSLGVFYSKDVTTLTPFEFLTARDKFRQSPPAFLAQPQYGEVEAYFGAAITLFHIYKLLFSHGIRPALEMLQQKLQQGSFARFIGRNETLWQVKAFMQQSVRHGAPNPKIVKMKEIIMDHFHSKDAGNSRVIIFTNFRESVKDIMGCLATLGHAVKAMEFIGQSSGKASKGQSQKVQQEVLQKFRAGGYNTIVATSIGEEGLDIMEVDLVICFDANVSPLRMIQRMGRTGRKRDGRVVILASEGSELQGYLQKQAKGKALGKHMHNGGINSFNFHSSPRMVPHSYQPEVQFVEMSIEKFVHRGRKVRGDAASIDPEGDDLSESEMDLLGKYFGSSNKGFWTPSIIAFPHYQLFPSRVYNVKHSFRTTEMLIDTLQSLKEHKASLFVPKSLLPNNEVGASSMENSQHVPDDANKTELKEVEALDLLGDVGALTIDMELPAILLHGDF
ncbi:DEAD-box ATP-dependent RNA helicase FANCM [Cryptomeria japonica]|uniref:DEAD-box ATP-dependent RNA helicase FANCM n=1 Tax=Cryptomeria japonica TaxID=3369 RepID=UPI0025ABCCD6|nr:DEAD-box ATP-dependent RNA helicase FANCM [Cryptomeria japonica]